MSIYCTKVDQNGDQVVRGILSTRAILRRYSYVVVAVFHSDFQQCRTLCGRIWKAGVVLKLSNLFGPFKTQVNLTCMQLL